MEFSQPVSEDKNRFYVYGNNGKVTPRDGQFTEYTLDGWFTVLARFRTVSAAIEYKELNPRADIKKMYIVNMENLTVVDEDYHKFKSAVDKFENSLK